MTSRGLSEGGAFWIAPTPGLSPLEQPGERSALSVVVPCFNGADGLDELHRRLSTACAAVVEDDYELILVDDGSKDATGPLLRHLASRDRHVVAVQLSRNYGHQLAMTAGLTVSRGDRVLIIDDDLQDPPELLAEMMAAMDRGADVVYGQRVERHGESWFKRASSTLFYRLLRSLSDTEIPPDTGDFRLMSRRAVDALLAMPEQSRFLRGMVSWIGFEQVPVRYVRAERFTGRTNYSLQRMLRLAGDAITSFSIRPLKLANYFSILLALAALLTLVYALHSWFTGQVVPGWTSVMTVVLLLGSAQMLILAIMCAYLGRLFIEAKRRPLFLIDWVARGTDLAPADAEQGRSSADTDATATERRTSQDKASGPQ